MSLQMLVTALLWLVGGSLLVAGEQTACEVVAALGLLHVMAAIGVSSRSGGARSERPTKSGRFRSEHLLVMAWCLCLGIAGALLLLRSGELAEKAHAGHLWLGSMCAVAASAWFILGRVVAVSRITSTEHGNHDIADQHERRDLADSGSLVRLLNELCWLSLIVLGVLVVGSSWPVLVTVSSFALNGWAIALLVEGLVNVAFALCLGRPLAAGLTRESGLRRWLHGCSQQDAEQDEWLGASFLATTSVVRGWRHIMRIWFVGLLAVSWLLTGLVVVRSNERAIYYRLGRLVSEPLEPGLHVVLPVPLARVEFVPVNQVKTLTVGFRANPHELARMPLSWTKPHGQAEFPLIIGNGTELVALNALVQFRVPNQNEAIRRYVSSARQPESLLASLAQRVLTTETRSSTLDDLLSGDRAEWNALITQKLAEQVEHFELGLEVVGFEFVSVHPPVEVASAYLDVVSARIDAEKVISETRAATTTELLRCEMVSRSDIANAKAAGADRWADANDEAAHMAELGTVDARYPQVTRRRVYCDVLSQELQARPLTLIDSTVPPNTQLWFEGAK